MKYIILMQFKVAPFTHLHIPPLKYLFTLFHHQIWIPIGTNNNNNNNKLYIIFNVTQKYHMVQIAYYVKSLI